MFLNFFDVIAGFESYSNQDSDTCLKVYFSRGLC